MNEMRMPPRPFADPEVGAVFASFPEAERRGLFCLRELIFTVAQRNQRVGKILEALRWGQPAYLTPETGSGSTLRLGLPRTGGFAIYTHCRTSILSEFQDRFPGDFTYEGNRAIHFETGEDLLLSRLEILVHRALTYHL